MSIAPSPDDSWKNRYYKKYTIDEKITTMYCPEFTPKELTFDIVDSTFGVLPDHLLKSRFDTKNENIFYFKNSYADKTGATYRDKYDGDKVNVEIYKNSDNLSFIMTYRFKYDASPKNGKYSMLQEVSTTYLSSKSLVAGLFTDSLSINYETVDKREQGIFIYTLDENMKEVSKIVQDFSIDDSIIYMKLIIENKIMLLTEVSTKEYRVYIYDMTSNTYIEKLLKSIDQMVLLRVNVLDDKVILSDRGTVSYDSFSSTSEIQSIFSLIVE